MKKEKIKRFLSDHLKDVRKRNLTCNQFQETDRIPINISEYGSYWADMQGVDIRDYYTNLELNIEVQRKGQEWRLKELRDDRADYGIRMDTGIVGEAIVFDCPVEYPQGTNPRIVHILKKEKDLDKLEIIPPEHNKRILEYEKKYQEFLKLVKRIDPPFPYPEKGHFSLQIHPPLSCACALMDPTKVYLYLYTNPALIKRFLKKMFDAFCLYRDYFDKKLKVSSKSLGLADDNSCQISAPMYQEFVLPLNKALYERYGKEYRYLHADGPNDHLFPIIAKELNLNKMDIGGWTKLEPAIKYLKGKTVIHGGMNNKDLYKGFTKEAEEKILKTIKLAGPGGGYEFAIGGETYPGVSPETLIELVRCVKRIGQYPIEI